MTKNQESTKEKILNQAEKLFSAKGLDGASIRDIANASEVNIAAINYHFKNKEALYWAVFFRAHENLSDGVEQIAKEAKDTVEVAEQMFDFMLGQGGQMRNVFKMMLSDNLTIPPEILDIECHDKYGPPGSEFFPKFIQQDIAQEVSETAMAFAIRAIFTYVAHWALMLNTAKCKMMAENDPSFSTEATRKTIRPIVCSILEYVEKYHAEL